MPPTSGDAGAMSDSSSESAQSTIPDEYAEYDELFLRLVEEEDVDLDPDSLWQESDASDDEQGSEWDETGSE